MQDQRYQCLVEKYHFQLEQFNFNKAFNECMDHIKGLKICCNKCQGMLRECIETKLPLLLSNLEFGGTKIILCSPISQFMCGFSECSKYFVSFNCNCEMTIVHLEKQKESFTVSLPGHQVIDKLMIHSGFVFIIVEKVIQIHSLVNGALKQKIELQFQQENFTPLSAFRFLISNKEKKSIQMWRWMDQRIKLLKEMFPKNSYDELLNFKNKVIIGQQQTCIHLLSPIKLHIIRSITIEYQFHNILIDDNISILNIYRSFCPKQKKVVYVNCFPKIQTFESNHLDDVDYTFENLYFYSGIMVGWDYDNPNKVGFMIYKFSK